MKFINFVNVDYKTKRDRYIPAEFQFLKFISIFLFFFLIQFNIVNFTNFVNDDYKTKHGKYIPAEKCVISFKFSFHFNLVP